MAPVVVAMIETREGNQDRTSGSCATDGETRRSWVQIPPVPLPHGGICTAPPFSLVRFALEGSLLPDRVTKAHPAVLVNVNVVDPPGFTGYVWRTFLAQETVAISYRY